MGAHTPPSDCITMDKRRRAAVDFMLTFRFSIRPPTDLMKVNKFIRRAGLFRGAVCRINTPYHLFRQHYYPSSISSANYALG